MNNRKPLVSLVVPTKNRYPYLIKLIELVRDFNLDSRFEFVIQDNNESNEEFVKYLNGHPMDCVKYYYDPTPMPISQNCDKAIRNSIGDYICFIGDDDFITRNFMPCVEWMEINKIECVFPRRIMYFWPDYCDFGDERSAAHFEPFSDEVRIYDTKEVLMDLLGSGCAGIANIPMIYHGIVKRELIEKIWTKCGTYFPGASPDIASGVSLCLVTDKYASFRFPIIIAGNSRTGGGGQKIIRHHAVLDLSSLPFLPSNISQIWCPRIPKIWSNSTIWCESVVEALNAFGRKDLVDKINFERLYVNFVVNYFCYRDLAYSLTRNKFNLFINSTLCFLLETFKKLVRVALKVVNLDIINTRKKILDIDDSKELCEYFDKEGLYFDNYFEK